MGILDKLLRKKLPSPADTFHITIGAASTKAFDLENDLRMLRSAVVYADQVKLCSTNMSYMYTLFGCTKDVQGFLAYLEKCISYTSSEQHRQTQIKQLDWIKEKLQKSYSEKKGLLEFIRKQMRNQQRGFKRQYPTLTTESEINGITKAIKDGVLELHTFQSMQFETIISDYHAGDMTADETGISSSTKTTYEEYMKVVSSVVTEGLTYPMFDDTTGQLVNARLEEKGLSPSDIRMQRAKHSALAGKLLERLPDFSLTPIDELIDIRNELYDPLKKFRGGVSTYATDMKSIPWNKSFADEANEVFIQKVNPSLLELEDMVKSGSNPLSHIGREAIKAQSLIGTGAAIGFFVDTPDSLPKYVKMMLGSVLPLSFAIGEGIKNYRNEKRKIKSHTLFFYYRLGKKIKK